MKNTREVLTEEEYLKPYFIMSTAASLHFKFRGLLATIVFFSFQPFAHPASWRQIGNDFDGEAAGDVSGRSVSLSVDGKVMAIGAGFNDGNGVDSGHVRVFQNVSGVWTQVGSDIDGEAVGDQAGESISLSADGSVVAIGAIANDGNGMDSGHVRIFQNVSGVWTQVGSDIDGEAEGDLFGVSVSLSADGSVVAIGAGQNDGNGVDSGHVRVFQNVSGAWTQVGNDIDGEAVGDQSGESVSLSADGSVVAIGGLLNDGNGVDSGHVRVFKNISGAWTQLGSDIDGESAGDLYGSSVSLSSDGSVVAIGAILNKDTGSFSGHVRVFQNVSGVWTQAGSDIDGEAVGDLFGLSVSLSSDGSVVAIGAVLNDGNGVDSGHVRVFQNVSGAWVQVSSDIHGEATGDQAGSSVSLSADGSVIAIGAVLNDGNGVDSGHVRVYRKPSGAWVQLSSDIDGEVAGDGSGSSVSLSADGSVVAIGAIENDGNGVGSGHVRVFQNVSGAWVQVGSDIDGEAAGDQAGFSVSLSSDGSVVAMGAPRNDGNGIFSGHVRVFQNVSGDWMQVGSDIDGEVADDGSGGVALSADGSVVAIGAPRNDGNGMLSGHVRVFENVSGAWKQVGSDINGEQARDGSGPVSLSADGSVVAIGAPRNDGNGVDSGHVRIYRNVSGAWTQVGSDINGEAVEDTSGISVSLSADGSVVAIGAPFNDGNGVDSGHVRVYRNLSGSWVQVGSDIDGEAPGDASGFFFSVSLSADGSVVAIGAIANDGNEVDSGHVRVFQNVSGVWMQVGSDIDGEAVGDASGWSVSLTADGSVVAIGAIGNDGGGVDSGHVRLFRYGDFATEPPIIRSPIWSQMSGYNATLHGQAQTIYRIQWSTDLKDWFDLTRFVSSSAETPFGDPNALGPEQRRFYRAVSP